MSDQPQRRVVCAAIRNPKGDLVLGARHYDALMRKTLDDMPRGQQLEWPKDKTQQGFIDQWGVFIDRREAWLVAAAALQIRRRVGGDGEELFSENLY